MSTTATVARIANQLVTIIKTCPLHVIRELAVSADAFATTVMCETWHKMEHASRWISVVSRKSVLDVKNSNLNLFQLKNVALMSTGIQTDNRALEPLSDQGHRVCLRKAKQAVYATLATEEMRPLDNVCSYLTWVSGRGSF